MSCPSDKTYNSALEQLSGCSRTLLPMKPFMSGTTTCRFWCHCASASASRLTAVGAAAATMDGVESMLRMTKEVGTDVEIPNNC